MEKLNKIEQSNEEFLEKHDITCTKHDDGWELESYTDGGGGQVVYVDNLTRDELVEYLENYDVNDETNLWFPNGQPGKGVPFDNYKDLWNDIENWRKWMLGVAKRMPDGEEVDEKVSPAQELLESARLDDLQNVFFSYAIEAPSYIYDFIALIDEDKLHNLYVEKLREMLTPDEIIENFE